MTESDLERKICDHVKMLGGRAFKWVSPGCTGVPDRIAIFPNGKIIFIEVKRPGRKNGLSPRQKLVLGWLENLGCTAWVISEIEDFKERLKDYGL